MKEFIEDNNLLGFDTEATGINCYRRGWRLRTAQYGNAIDSFVVPAKYRKFIRWSMLRAASGKVRLIAHNGPHDIRSVDHHLGEETGALCKSETYIPAHYKDPRSREDGGIGHGLKDFASAHVDPGAGRWEVALKKAFSDIQIPIKGEVYKSGPRRGTQKYRKAKVSEGYSLIPLDHPAYIAYAGADTILAYRSRQVLAPLVRQFADQYRFDFRVQQVCDQLQRRGILLDVAYTEDLSEQYEREAARREKHALWKFGCDNVQSGQQIAEVLLNFDVRLQKTDKGNWITKAETLRRIRKTTEDRNVKEFITTVLTAKQLRKRKTTYADAMLEERDEDDRIHTSINSLIARTTRMSASGPPLQQLPTKDREDEMDEDWEWEEE